MRPVRTFQVRPLLPETLKPLEEIAYNLRWSWDHETIALFRRLDRDLWETSGHNPVMMLGTISQETLQEAAEDEAFLVQLDRVRHDLESYMAIRGNLREKIGPSPRPLVAYFSMEFGLTECLPIYSGGLGILAGDHLKSSSDLALPLIAVGLMYQKGYFRQYLSPEGWQVEHYRVNDYSTLPLRLYRDDKGEPLRVTVDLAGRTALVQFWRAQVGRVPLVLLDTNIPENPADIQDITDELYGGDSEMRIRQEILLGVAGRRALDALGERPRVYHLNEGHCAFVSLERIRFLMRLAGLSFQEAREMITATSTFTLHTPVPAGIDVFPQDLMERYFSGYWSEVGLTREEFLDLGRVHPGDPSEPFNMAVLAIRTSGFINGVSLHGYVSREVWKEIWPGIPSDEIPIRHITNGCHPPSWISEEMRSLYDRYLGPRWASEGGDTRDWRRAEQIPGEELWRVHERRRERLVSFARRRMVEQLQRQGANRGEIAAAEEALDPEALTIGFGRRFATYKRATLLLSDPDRLARILNQPGRLVQIIYSGKAHPRDDAGKALIRQIIQISRRPEFSRRIIFLEDYDSVVARYMVEGCDVWLNTPRRPMEASGTSGMKAAFNGALNLSIRDGWWDEAYSTRTGWAIGRGEDHHDLEYLNRVEAGTLYALLEQEVVPLFYTRGHDGVPHEWIAMMKSALGDLCPIYNTHRMLRQYVQEAYAPAEARRPLLEDQNYLGARELSKWRGRIRRGWSEVRVVRVEADTPHQMKVGEGFEVKALIHPGPLTAADLKVEIFMGRVDENREISQGELLPMSLDGATGQEGLLFRARVPLSTSGTQGFTVRVLPHHDLLLHPHQTGFILWAS
jgi:glycogen phosphorylase